MQFRNSACAYGTAAYPPNVKLCSETLLLLGIDFIDGQECFRPVRFFDVGALVWFARIIEWEFPGFSVDACKDRLLEAERMLETKGFIEGRTHRFLLAAAKNRSF